MPAPSQLAFVHHLVSDLPGAVLPPTPSRPTPGIFFAETSPTPVSNPELLTWSAEAAVLLDLPGILTPDEQKDAAAIFTGNRLLEGTRPYATRYGGHQFGHWAGQLGDGRAITLGEVRNATGEYWEVQLKGAGPTPYSRNADGRAVLRSSLREFLCSEAMFHLGVPTTRALCCVTTGDSVVRDLFYDGNPRPEPGAITTRLAPSFLRLGHFEILAASEEFELLKSLVTTSIRLLFPKIAERHSLAADGTLADELILDWFEEVSNRTADLMVEWQRVGFVHGVMNTDNLSILGLTVDYGPYGWLDVHDPNWTPNTTDAERRRYRFGHQPSIALWNLSRFAGALLPLASNSETLVPRFQQVLEGYRSRFGASYLRMRAAKLGFFINDDEKPDERLQKLLERFDELLTSVETDGTLLHRLLPEALAKPPNSAAIERLDSIRESFYVEVLPAEVEARWSKWLADLSGLWQAPIHLSAKSSGRRVLMDSVNPYFVLRNYLVQEALDELEQGMTNRLRQLQDALKTPYLENDQTRPFFKRRPEWARTRAGCAALSCSS